MLLTLLRQTSLIFSHTKHIYVQHTYHISRKQIRIEDRFFFYYLNKNNKNENEGNTKKKIQQHSGRSAYNKTFSMFCIFSCEFKFGVRSKKNRENSQFFFSCYFTQRFLSAFIDSEEKILRLLK